MRLLYFAGWVALWAATPAATLLFLAAVAVDRERLAAPYLWCVLARGRCGERAFPDPEDDDGRD
jgi:hypothetical protein